MKTTYFLFGSDACEVLSQEGEEALLSYGKLDFGWDVFKFEDGVSSPTDLLNCFCGWADFTIITEELYNKLLNL